MDTTETKKRNIPAELMTAIIAEMLEDRKRYGGKDGDYAKTLGINASIFNRIKKGEHRVELLSEAKWLYIGRKLNVMLGGTHWNAVETDVYLELQDDFNYCQRNARSLILVDDCGIGKTFCAKILVSKMKNAFYLDASQYKTKRLFIKALAQEVGCATEGSYNEMLENLRYYINALGNVFICIDEAGDLDYPAFLELKGLINGTMSRCGWYMMGADGLRSKIERGINNKKVGYKEIFDRFAAKFRSITPDGIEDKIAFYEKLFYDVARHNMDDKKEINQVVTKCFSKRDNKIKSLRYLETLIRIPKNA